MAISFEQTNKVIQLDLFISEEKVREKEEEERFKKMTQKSLRGLYARHNHLEERLMSLEESLELILETLKMKNPLSEDKG